MHTTPLKKQTAKAIVNIFETGSVLGDYSMVRLIDGDPGHLAFGRSQSTLDYGNLHKLLQQYSDSPGDRLGTALAPFLPRCAVRDYGS